LASGSESDINFVFEFEEAKAMKKQTMFFTVLAVTFVLIAVPGFAQKGGNANGHSGIDAGSHGPKEAHSGGPAEGKADFVSKIEANQKLDSKLQAMLPPNEPLSQAAKGFKNEGQFIAAVNVSHNLNIPFDTLKSKITGPNTMSLGAAIKALRPDLTDQKAKDAAKTAEKEAKEAEKS
jgi:hypothetical protein